jgi:hypothetical protein
VNSWRCVLELDAERRPIAGSSEALYSAIQNAADLRIGTEFRHNEHIDVESFSDELVQEVAEFGVTYCLDDCWSAGIMSLRQPISLPDGFGARPSMSFFLYNQDASQGIARPHLDGRFEQGVPGASTPAPPDNMPKYEAFDNWDAGTDAPSHNFIYRFDGYRFCVNETWRHVLHHSACGDVISGSLDELVHSFRAGCAIKLGLRGLCSDFAASNDSVPHEVFVQGGSAYFYTQRRQLIIGTHPVVRVAPAIPLRYRTSNWDFGWLMVRTDGHVVYRRCDPMSLRFTDHSMSLEVRWFVR